MAISPIVVWRAESPSSSSFFLAKSSCSTLFNGYIMLYQVIFYVWLFCKSMISQCLLLKSVSWSKLFQVSNDQWLNQALGLFFDCINQTTSKVEFPVQFFVNLAPLVVALHSGFIFSAVVFPCSLKPVHRSAGCAEVQLRRLRHGRKYQGVEGMGLSSDVCWFRSLSSYVIVIKYHTSWLLYGYGSIPNTIFSGMNIHLPAILGFTRYQGFDPSPYSYKPT